MSEFLINEAKQFRAAERSFGLDCFVGAVAMTSRANLL
jgi:hypothetical protein